MTTTTPGPARVDTGGIFAGGAPGPETLAEIWALCDAGLFVQAHERTRAFGPLARWRWSAGAMAVAARLAQHLGAPRLGLRLAVAAHRRDPGDPRAAVVYGYLLHQHRGPYALWSWARKAALNTGATDQDRAEIVGLRATAAGELRDFEKAAELIDEAERLAPGSAEIAEMRASLLEEEDRYAEAAAVATTALRENPGQRRVAQLSAHLLLLEGRRAEALDVLVQAQARFESAGVSLRLAGLYVEDERHEDAERCLDRAEQLSPLIEPAAREALALGRADCAYRRGDFERARALLGGVENPFFAAFRERLLHPEDHRRRKLDVPFVRQHDRTCAPATLAAIARFWSRSDEHLEIASAICYDGTPDHRERAWADENGWITREFRVTWDAVVALIDRGVPFVLSTYGTTAGHAQAVIGYDVLRRTVIVRDPFHYDLAEGIADRLFEAQAPTGPRGLALVPASEGARLEGLELPEADLYDHLHRLQRALFRHDRAAAAAALADLAGAAPDHRLVHAGRRTLAVYDEDRAALLACAEAQLRTYPTAFSAAVETVVAMRATATRGERIARLEELVRKSADPIFLELLAEELSADDRSHARARRLAERAVLRGRTRAESHGLLGSLFWERQELDLGLELFRFAACLRDRDEGAAQRYALAARIRGRADEALRFARERAARHGARSHAPIFTLARVLDLFDRTAESMAVLEEAIAARPDDAALALAATAPLANGGQIARARELLARAEGKSPPVAWGRAAAVLATYDATPEEQLAAWRRVLEREPLAVDAHGTVAALLEILHGRDEARRHLAAARAAFPHSHPLGQLWIAWLAKDDPAMREAELRRLLEVEPDDAWALRELALHLGAQRRFDEAFALCEQARLRDPLDTREALVRGHLELLRGHAEAAREAFRAALDRSPDAVLAIANLLVLASTREERDAEVGALARRLVERGVGGAGFLTWYENALPLADPARLDALVEEIRSARPELPAAWSIAARQHLSCDRLEEAWSVAREAAERFPLSAEAWSDLAQIASARSAAFARGGPRPPGASPSAPGSSAGAPDDAEEELRARKRAHETSPFHVPAAHALALCYERLGRGAEARAVLERMAAREPGNVPIALFLASLERSAGQKEAARDRVRRVLRHAPTSMEALTLFHNLGVDLGDPESAVRLARENIAASPESPALHLALARLLLARSLVEDASRELDEALALDPFSIEAREQKAYALAAMGRFDDAEAACAPLEGEEAPMELLGRAAWVKAVRGDADLAIAAMRAAVARHPSFAWGFRKLAAWHGERYDHAAQVECLRELVKIAPDDGAAHAELGVARIALGAREAARRSFERALTLANEDPQPAKELFDLQIDDGDLEGAERSMRLLRRNAPPLAALAEVEIGLRRGDEDRAIAAFRRVCVLPDAPSGIVLAARRRLVWGGLGERAQREMEDLCGDPAVHQAIAATWARTSLLRGDGVLDRRLDALDPTAPGARSAALGALTHHVTKRERFRLFRWLLRRRTWMKGHADLWSGAASALVACDLPRIAAIWLSGCPLDGTDSPAAWAAIARTLRAVGKPGRAIAASRRARLAGAGPNESYHRAWLAFDAALAADDARASRLLAAVNEPGLDPPEQAVVRAARAMLHFRALPPPRRRGAFREAETELDEICDALGKFRGGVLCARRARLRIARDVRMLSAWGWAAGSWAAGWGALAVVAAYVAYLAPSTQGWLLGALVLLVLFPHARERSWPPTFELSPARIPDAGPESASRAPQEAP